MFHVVLILIPLLFLMLPFWLLSLLEGFFISYSKSKIILSIPFFIAITGATAVILFAEIELKYVLLYWGICFIKLFRMIFPRKSNGQTEDFDFTKERKKTPTKHSE